LDILDCWAKIKVPLKRKQYFITNNKEINFSDKEYSQHNIATYQHIILLGFIIDPYNLTYSNQQIVDSLVKYESRKDLFKALEVMSGKYIIFYVSKEEEILLTDHHLINYY